ncbi:DUF3025 domain-containing protein [Rheinheimera riviphila]|uniref:DUF3025 domain-containing protein n=1 Tax=Rheinheimera riviphila TaxID=1834037 RepID=A0A437QT48_9GAMM|nr:DUF3025 domain-containing protein [Rheinheimera riviphila]RVU37681.1 DUF3025 domain-containing protein [Rheinheimera riviphila]
MTDQKPSQNAVMPLPQPTKTARFVAPEQWDDQIWLENPIFAELTTLFPLASCTDFPNVMALDNWRQQFRPEFRPELPVRFVDNELLAADGRYYEAFIYHTRQVPTRYPNWHDLFGALIWCLFPQTKKLLNQLHIREIELHGASIRTALRNKLTLLDECGVLILYRQQQANVVEMLRQHQWQHAFVSQRHCWFGQGNNPGVTAMMFGHANYEMATRPFIGLTGKMLAMVVPDDFFSQSLRQRIDFIDTALSEQIANQGIFGDPLQLTPLPLLGVPGWFFANEQPDFYQNSAYFRPKRITKIQD